MSASGDKQMTAKLAELDINTDDSSKLPSFSSPSFSPLNSTNVAASDDVIMSDEKLTETETEAMITLGLPTKFSSTPRFGFQKQTARKPGRKVHFNKYWAHFNELFVNLVTIAQNTNSAAAVDEVLQPIVTRRARLIPKHRSADRFLELATGFSNQTTFPDLTEYVKHYIDFDVRESNVIRAHNAAKSVVAKFHNSAFALDFPLQM
uniref:GLOBIN domain-containing protein n=1 Tax=Panagrellus redivivus TaxID=6233 RepID=A0A7E4URN8_PANRE